MINERVVASEVVGRVVERARAGAAKPRGRPLEELVNETLYQEQGRLRRAHGERADADRAFYARVRHELPRAGGSGQVRLLTEIVLHYAREIAGHFDARVYKVATSLLPFGLNALVTSLSPRRVLKERTLWSDLDQHLVIEGEVEALHRLKARGTVVLVPTHSSNLDSVLMGYAVYRMKLPPVTYGAGLNLFDNPLIGYFMRHLGAYTVDRLKTDPLYRETLKEYATLTIELGQDNLFFPGGTRSRSGGLETHLKKGLLGTGLAAYRNNLVHKKAEPRVYYVPITLSYPLVLEAATLVEDYLAESGKHRYIIVDDEFSRVQRIVQFLRGLMEVDLRIHLRVGRALDPFGNDVDDEGRSLDPRGRAIEPSRYLLHDGEYDDDPVRDAEYTRSLAERITGAFRRENTVLPTHAVAYAVLDLARRKHPGFDLYRLLRTLGPETGLPQREVEERLERLLGELKALADKGAVRLEKTLAAGDVGGTLRQALRSFGTYHQTPVLERRGVRLHLTDPKLVFYYRNRLEGYGLLGGPDLLAAGSPS